MEFLTASRRRSRVQAIHRLSGGNHRITIVLTQFITRDTVDGLLELHEDGGRTHALLPGRVRWLPRYGRLSSISAFAKAPRR